jgi:hypothetical protein
MCHWVEQGAIEHDDVLVSRSSVELRDPRTDGEERQAAPGAKPRDSAQPLHLSYRPRSLLAQMTDEHPGSVDTKRVCHPVLDRFFARSGRDSFEGFVGLDVTIRESALTVGFESN